ncbi:hypothetical protein [Microvirga pudoricolor]|uniref:hypothetical protein n=1 Tax=Microvirga pudoricolor TaxID=2778729 RepID=UPI00194FD53A|nr:hypothetical protein [Microvirga pudoricolor]MBM6596763.1 hypothetical protein [Microvirga pudoricolor]
MRDVRTMTDAELDAVSGGTRSGGLSFKFYNNNSANGGNGGRGGDAVAVNKKTITLGLIAVSGAVAVGGNGGNGGNGGTATQSL